ncbi:hypothetical protein OQA88_9390 [Cercophora sp. LCS_1]
MATQTATQRMPASLLTQQPSLQVRRYGRSDFQKFDAETTRGPHLCSHWGVLGPERTPAGIVYMDITFKQPHGYWLSHANVFITLAEDSTSYALSPPSRSDRNKTCHAPQKGVSFAEHFGPRFLTGTPTAHYKTKQTQFVPTFGAMGFEIGGIGRSHMTSREHVNRWTFKGTICRPNDSSDLRTLEWEFSENQLDPTEPHPQEYQTAFTFEHSQRPVYMRVEIDGKLKSKSQQAKHNFLRFSSKFEKNENSTLTCIGLTKAMTPIKHLDSIAAGLDMTMQMRNAQNQPVEMPGPASAIFTTDTTTGNQKVNMAPEPTPSTHEPKTTSHARPSIKEAEQRPFLQTEDFTSTADEQDPVLISLQRQLQNRKRHLTVIPNDTEEISTVLDLPKKSDTPAQIATTGEGLDQEIAALLKLIFIKIIATIMQVFARTQQASPDGTSNQTPAIKISNHQKYTEQLEEEMVLSTDRTRTESPAASLRTSSTGFLERHIQMGITWIIRGGSIGNIRLKALRDMDVYAPVLATVALAMASASFSGLLVMASVVNNRDLG